MVTSKISISKLPKEILFKIIDRLEYDYGSLFNCSLTCWSFWEAATATLYRDIDFRVVNLWNNECQEAIESNERQFTCMQSIINNPSLGSFVRTFTNHEAYNRDNLDITRFDTQPEDLVAAATNMKNLSRAFFNQNGLALQVIMNLSSYHQLTDLTIINLDPTLHIWKNAPTALRKLKWVIPYKRGIPDMQTHLFTDQPVFLLKVVEATCPEMENLEISLQETGCPDDMEPFIQNELVQEYKCLPEFMEAKLKKIRHFGLDLRTGGYYQHDTKELENHLLQFIQRHKDSLESLAIPGNEDFEAPWEREGLDFVLQACSLPRQLKHLALTQTQHVSTKGSSMTWNEFLSALTANSATAKIESFSVEGNTAHFSEDFGRCFQPWKNLKFLRVGDILNTCGIFDDDGFMRFDKYAPHIMEFIAALPSSIQELYLDIHCGSLGIARFRFPDQGDNPICSLGEDIFKAQPRLHTCDIDVWHESHSGLESPPTVGAFYRRLPSTDQNPKSKNIWTSRILGYGNAEGLDEEDIMVLKSVQKLTDESFRGEDAKQVWLNGYERSKAPKRTESGEIAEEDLLNLDWPFYYNPLRNYGMWVERE